VKLKLAFFGPVDCGANWTATVQEPCTTTVPPPSGHEVPETAITKSDAVAPVRVTLEMLSVALPWFVKVTLCAPLWLPTFSLLKISEGAEKLTIGAGGVPTPVSGTICSVFADCPELL